MIEVMKQGQEILRVTPEGEFIWHQDADRLIEEGDFSNSPAMPHILRKLRQAIAEAEKQDNGKLKVTLQDTPTEIELAQYKRMFEAACSALGAIGDALGVDPEEGGAEPILAAIQELKAEKQEPVAWLHTKIEGVAVPHRPADLDKHPERWEALYKTPPPCPTCEALARTVMLDQTSHDTPPQRQPLTEREVELIDGMIEVQLQHAMQCDRIANRTMADKQKGWDMERVELLQKLKAAHGIKGEA